MSIINSLGSYEASRIKPEASCKLQASSSKWGQRSGMRIWGLGLFWWLVVGGWGFFAFAQPDQPGPARNRTLTQIGTNRVSITVTGGQRVIQGNGWPDHAPRQVSNPAHPH